MAQKKRSLADRVKAPVAVNLTAEAQEEALKKLQNKNTAIQAARKKKVRVSVDFPWDLYDQMKKVSEKNGQTHRGFIISLVREHLNK